MNRRSFLRQLFLGGIGTAAAVEHMLSGSVILLPDSLPLWYGIPYHQSNAFSGTWLGISRSEFPQWSSKVAVLDNIKSDIIKMINLLEEDKKNDYWNGGK